MTDGSAATPPADQAGDLLAPLRRVALMVSASLPALLLVLWLALDGQVTGSFDDPVPWLLLGVGLAVAIAGNRYARSQILLATDLEGFVGRYRVSFFIGLATGETPALLGFVSAFVIGAVWPMLIGLLPALVCIWAIVPTPDRLRGYDSAFRSRGVDLKPSDLLQRQRPAST